MFVEKRMEVTDKREGGTSKEQNARPLAIIGRVPSQSRPVQVTSSAHPRFLSLSSYLKHAQDSWFMLLDSVYFHVDYTFYNDNVG